MTARRPAPVAAGPRRQTRCPMRLGDYLLLRRVGSGGMGIVYEAIQESLGRHVALKTFPAHHLDDATRLERFRREARAAARLHHAHIVPVLGSASTTASTSTPCSSSGGTDWTPSCTRSSGCGATGDRASRRRRDRTSRIPRPRPCSGPSPLGDPGIGRRPAIPGRRAPTAGDRSDCPTSPRPVPRSVADRGDVAEALDTPISRASSTATSSPPTSCWTPRARSGSPTSAWPRPEDSDELTRTGDIVGTLRYMAPERFNGWSDPRSDVYALGATLYELLTLRPAFEESDRIKLIEQVLHRSPPPPRQLDRRIPRDLETIVLKAMAREPGERYPTAGQLAEDLRRFARAGRSWPAGPARSNAHGAGASATRGWPAATVAVAAALVAVAVIAVLDADRQHHFATEQARATRKITGLANRPQAIAGRIEPPAGDPQLRPRSGGLREGSDRPGPALDDRELAVGGRGR